jgi:hypothetical protein
MKWSWPLSQVSAQGSRGRRSDTTQPDASTGFRKSAFLHRGVHMECKPSVVVALCLFALSLCLTPGCGSKSQPEETTSRGPGYFGSVGRGPGEALELDLKEKADSKPAKRAR